MTYPSHQFRPLSLETIELVRQWRNSPRISRQVRQASSISQEAQLNWFQAQQKDTSSQYYVLFQQQLPIGVLAFTHITHNRCEWGCYIGEERYWPGTGLVVQGAALDFAFNQLKVACLYAEVFADNPGPQRTHALFGFNKIGSVGRSGERELLGFECYQEDWALRRAQVLAKLPDKIVQAIQNVEFEILK